MSINYHFNPGSSFFIYGEQLVISLFWLLLFRYSQHNVPLKNNCWGQRWKVSKYITISCTIHNNGELKVWKEWIFRVLNNRPKNRVTHQAKELIMNSSWCVRFFHFSNTLWGIRHLLLCTQEVNQDSPHQNHGPGELIPALPRTEHHQLFVGGRPLLFPAVLQSPASWCWTDLSS